MIKLIEQLQKHSRALYLVIVLIAIAGGFAYVHLPSDVYPELSFPRIAVIVNAGDLAPERVLLTVTRPLEEATSQVYNVRWIRSKTIRGASELSIEFEPGTDMIFALHQVQSRIAEAQGNLPLGVSTTTELVTPSIFPVLSYNLTSKTLTQSDLYTLARYQIQPALTRVAGVARVQLQGGDIPQVAIEVDPEKLKSYHLSLSQVADALKRTNQIQVVGRLEESHQQNLVVATGEAVDLKDFGNMVVATPTPGVPVYLKDIARASEGYADRLSLVSVKKNPGVVINIFRQPNSNVVAVSDGIKQELSRVKSTLPLGVEITAGYDQSSLVKQAIDSVREAIAIGILLIIVVLFIFLRTWQSTFIAALTIPLSALASFGMLYLLKQGLNLMSLGGLAIAIGLVIDDAIVVIENIDRQLRHNLDPQQAVRQALVELSGPVTSSTATTVVVFLPLGLLSGVAGQFFTSLTITLASAVIFSWLIALTLTPMLAAKLLKKTTSPKASAPSKLSERYGKVLALLLKQPLLPLSFATIVVVSATFAYNNLGTDFLPALDEGSYVIDYFAPAGTSLSDTDALASKIESIVAKSKDVRTWTRRTGSELGLFATETNTGDILVVLNDRDKRKQTIDEVMEAQRVEIAKELPQLEIEFHQLLQDQLNDMAGAASPMEVHIFGEAPNVLHELAEKVQALAGTIKGVVDITATSREGAPVLDLHVDPLAAGRIGLQPADVTQQVQDALLGRAATQIRRGDKLIDVRVRLSDVVRFDAQQLKQIPIVGLNGVTLPLSALATIDKKAGEREITCENQQRYILVEGNLEGRDLGSAVKEWEQKISKMHLPVGYSYQVAGLYVSQKESFSQLATVLCLATILVYLLLVMQFRSLVQPLAILAALPLSFFGVEAALLMTGTPLNVSSFMGIILLVGLVVKNGIILLEYTNRLRASGLDVTEALIQAGKVRLRPILMTTICTILGLLPLAMGMGAGAELQKPLAIAVIGGLSLSTIFTLLFVPTIYLALEKLNSVKMSA